MFYVLLLLHQNLFWLVIYHSDCLLMLDLIISAYFSCFSAYSATLSRLDLEIFAELERWSTILKSCCGQIIPRSLAIVLHFECSSSRCCVGIASSAPCWNLQLVNGLGNHALIMWHPIHYHGTMFSSLCNQALNAVHHHDQYLFAVILLAGDIETNPGPCPPRFPCGVSSKACSSYHGAKASILCESCELWFHAECVGLSDDVFNVLGRSDTPWEPGMGVLQM